MIDYKPNPELLKNFKRASKLVADSTKLIASLKEKAEAIKESLDTYESNCKEAEESRLLALEHEALGTAKKNELDNATVFLKDAEQALADQQTKLEIIEGHYIDKTEELREYRDEARRSEYRLYDDSRDNYIKHISETDGLKELITLAWAAKTYWQSTTPAAYSSFLKDIFPQPNDLSNNDSRGLIKNLFK